MTLKETDLCFVVWTALDTECTAEDLCHQARSIGTWLRPEHVEIARNLDRHGALRGLAELERAGHVTQPRRVAARPGDEREAEADRRREVVPQAKPATAEQERRAVRKRRVSGEGVPVMFARLESTATGGG